MRLCLVLGICLLYVVYSEKTSHKLAKIVIDSKFFFTSALIVKVRLLSYLWVPVLHSLSSRGLGPPWPLFTVWLNRGSSTSPKGRPTTWYGASQLVSVNYLGLFTPRYRSAGFESHRSAPAHISSRKDVLGTWLFAVKNLNYSTSIGLTSRDIPAFVLGRMSPELLDGSLLQPYSSQSSSWH